jgi:predicted RNA-binding Zn-ribbon protein involved in translation (DUF1610 family)
MKLLVADIETSPNLMHVWSLFQKGPLNYQMIIESSRMISFASKWAGTKDYQYGSVYHTGHSQMVHMAWALLDECDGIIHYNGKKFDIPKLNREFLLMGLTPPSPYRQIDLYHTIRNRFAFPSNKLDYVSTELGIGSKVQHGGYDLWAKCVLQNDPEAWELMQSYNIGDVDLTEELYFRILPWIEKHPVMVTDGEEIRCLNCGSTEMIRQGFAYTQARKYQRYRCNNCGKWGKATKAEPGYAAKVSEVQSG